MIQVWLETPIIDKSWKQIVIYKQYIDDILLIWSGSFVELCHFQAMFRGSKQKYQAGMAKLATDIDSADPAMFFEHRLLSIDFLDLDIQTVKAGVMVVLSSCFCLLLPDLARSGLLPQIYNLCVQDLP
jgi:hypothetical protein